MGDARDRSTRQTALALVAQGGDHAAFNELIVGVRHFLVRQAKRVAQGKYGEPIPSYVVDELVAEATLHIYKNLSRFDPARGSWIAFVFWWTKAAFQAWVRENAHAVRESWGATEARAKFNYVRRQLGPAAATMTDAELWARTGVARDLATTTVVHRVRDVSLDNDEDVLLTQYLARRTSTNYTPEDALIDRVQTERLMSTLAQLDPRQRLILERRYGIGCDESTLQDIGNELGVTRERVRQLEAEGMTNLRRLMVENGA